MLSIEDVAQKLGTTPAKVRELVLSGQLSASRQDGELSFTQADLNMYILDILSAIDDDDEDDDHQNDEDDDVEDVEDVEDGEIDPST